MTFSKYLGLTTASIAVVWFWHIRSKRLNGVARQPAHSEQRAPPPATLETLAAQHEEESICPDEFRCSITHEVMHDPVITADGYTYERWAIEEWLRSTDSRNTSPRTNIRLLNTTLVPNFALKALIVDYHLGFFPTAETCAPTPPRGILVNDKVLVVGLVTRDSARQQWNNSEGIVQGYDALKMRYHVQMSLPIHRGKIISVKAINLRIRETV